MFTGIITHIGEITEIKKKEAALEILLKSNLDLKKITIGQSIACDGCCLTVTEINPDSLRFFFIS
jgi:riboflavin synthase